MDGLWWLWPAIFVIAFVYASVGHGGASGYLAALSFVAVRPDEMATTALTLNVLVAGTALMAFARAGHSVGRLIWPFLVASMPAAFLGGTMNVSGQAYARLLGLSLIVAAARLWLPIARERSDLARPPSLAVALPVGTAVGWLSGVVGVGGGIFLSPILLLRRWATSKQTAASSACFIFVNSAAGLGGRAARGAIEYGAVWPLLVAALAGGLIGAHLGANHFSGVTLKRLLAGVLVVASFKLFLMAGRVT